jgi:transcriptional regulator with XRE-family HTH domain
MGSAGRATVAAMASRTPRDTLGGIIRQQRELAALPMRQLAAMVGISGPYLSQIERGLRNPSEKVLEAIAGGLQMSADALLAETETADARTRTATPGVPQAIDADPLLDDEQRRVLRDLYMCLVRDKPT